MAASLASARADADFARQIASEIEVERDRLREEVMAPCDCLAHEERKRTEAAREAAIREAISEVESECGFWERQRRMGEVRGCRAALDRLRKMVPGLADEAEEKCATCGHVWLEHTGGRWACELDSCACEEFQRCRP